MPHTKRQIHEEGHKRKFMVIADETPESEAAVYFAASRARNTDSQLLMLYVIEPVDFQHWMSVEELHKQEQEEKARAVFRLYRRRLRAQGFEDLPREEVVKIGAVTEEIVNLINEDRDIGFLVLGASTSSKGPGKLVTWLSSGAAADFPIPYVVVPGALTMDEIAALC